MDCFALMLPYVKGADPFVKLTAESVETDSQSSDDADYESIAATTKRREQLCRELSGLKTDMPFEALLDVLCVEDEYEAFKHRFSGIFAAIALRAIAYVDETAVQSKILDSARAVIEAELTGATDADSSVNAQLRSLDSYKALEYVGLEGQTALIRYFKGILEMTRYAIAVLSSDNCKAWPKNPYANLLNSYNLMSCQEHNMDETLGYTKHFSGKLVDAHIPIVAQPATLADEIFDSVFGEMADYAHAIWTCQPTRLFVPVLLIHGVQLSLVVFTRKGWHNVDLGPFAHTDNQPDSRDFDPLSGTICKLLYFLSLPPQKFGHFCDVSRRIWGEYEFVRRRDPTDEDQDPVLVDVNISNDSTDSSIAIANECRIEQTIDLRGRMAHKFRVKHRGECAILKLSWTPANRMPESAVYDALKAANIPNIPSVIDSGIIVKNSFGYRVEYLLIEDCGVPLVEYLQAQLTLGIDELSDIAASVMSQAVECIYSGWNAGILHCNITADSVVVKDSRVTIPDWGHAKFAKDCAVDVDTLAAKWLFDKNKVAGDGDCDASTTATPLYASIPVLVGATQRSIVDDIESVLYVAIDALYKLQVDPPVVGMVGAKLYCSTTLALMRACCMGHDRYMEAVGVAKCSELFAWLMDTFREYLFVRNGEYIGRDLAIDPEFERTVEIQQLERILVQIKERVFGKSPVSNTGKKPSQVGKSSTSVKAPRRSKRFQSKKRRR
ncbi:hypothetical protein GGF48_000167 [Coemansia sp. RSA 921]|nr:hypothetical protein GGF48_000167 [Coemansia sp. RSA 921]